MFYNVYQEIVRCIRQKSDAWSFFGRLPTQRRTFLFYFDDTENQHLSIWLHVYVNFRAKRRGKVLELNMRALPSHPRIVIFLFYIEFSYFCLFLHPFLTA